MTKAQHNLLTKRLTWRPTMYPQALEFQKKQKVMAWTVEEIDFQEDVQDWNSKISLKEKSLLTNILRFFTQGDIIVFDAYLDKFIPLLGGHPEVKQMMTENAASESIHVQAYAKLLETLGFDDSEFEAFADIKEMQDKVDYLNKFDPSKYKGKLSKEQKKEVAVALAVYAAFMEGVSLFASFAMLLSFRVRGLMKSMGTVVEWSIRDEDNHSTGMAWLFRTFIQENPEIWDEDLKGRIYQACRDIIKLEDAFIDKAYEICGDLPNCNKEDVKRYIRYVANRRCNAIGLHPPFEVEDNPLAFMSWVLMDGHTNFFEAKATQYKKNAPEDFFSGAPVGFFDVYKDL